MYPRKYSKILTKYLGVCLEKWTRRAAETSEEAIRYNFLKDCDLRCSRTGYF